MTVGGLGGILDVADWIHVCDFEVPVLSVSECERERGVD